jgi:hypothetical protein
MQQLADRATVSSQHGTAWLEAVGVAALTVIAAVLLFLLHLYGEPILVRWGLPPDAAKFIAMSSHELAMACGIAAALTLSVEYLTQRRHTRLERRFEISFDSFSSAIARNVLRATVAKHLPDSVINQLESHVFDRSLYRDRCSVTYILKPDVKEDGSPFVSWTQHQVFSIVNKTSEEQTSKLIVAFSTLPEYATHCRVEEIKIDGVTQTIADGDVMHREDGLVYTYPKDLKIPPGSSRKVEVSNSAAGPSENWETFMTSLPVDYLEMTINRHQKRFDIVPASLHPDDPKEEENNSAMVKWSLNGVLPGQGLMFAWRLKPLPAKG